MVENIATLMDPPASDRSEVDWISSVVAASDCDLLLDLHNVHANSINFGFDPIAYLDRLDPDRIGAIHLASAGSFAHKRAIKGARRRLCPRLPFLRHG